MVIVGQGCRTSGATCALGWRRVSGAAEPAVVDAGGRSSSGRDAGSVWPTWTPGIVGGPASHSTRRQTRSTSSP